MGYDEGGIGEIEVLVIGEIVAAEFAIGVGGEVDAVEGG